MTHATMLALQILAGIPVREPDQQLDGRRACPTNRNLPKKAVRTVDLVTGAKLPREKRPAEALEFDATAARLFLEGSCGLPSCTRCQAEILAALSLRAQKLVKEATP